MDQIQNIALICILNSERFLTGFAFPYQWNVDFPMTRHQLHMLNISKLTKNDFRILFETLV